MSKNKQSALEKAYLVRARVNVMRVVFAKLGLPILGAVGLVVALAVLLGSDSSVGAVSCGPGGVGTAQGANNTEVAYHFLASDSELDLQPFQAAAIVGNLIHESGGDPIVTDVVNSIGAVGIAQWYQKPNEKYGRRSGLYAHAKAMNLPWTDLRAQLSYMKYELTVTRLDNLEALRRTTNIKDATEVFEATYEVSGMVSTYPKRVGHAISVRDRYGSSVSGVNATSTCSTSVDGSLSDPGPGPQDPSNGNLVPRASNLRAFILERWGCSRRPRPCIREIGGYSQRPAGTPQDHTEGLALDVTLSDGIGSYPNSSQLALGWEIACFLQVNAHGLGVQYQIWQELIWNVSREGEGSAGNCSGVTSGWRPYTYGFGVTGGHYDHIHITVKPGVGG